MEVVFSPPVCVEDIYIFIFLAKGCRGGSGLPKCAYSGRRAHI